MMAEIPGAAGAGGTEGGGGDSRDVPKIVLQTYRSVAATKIGSPVPYRPVNPIQEEREYIPIYYSSAGERLNNIRFATHTRHHWFWTTIYKWFLLPLVLRDPIQDGGINGHTAIQIKHQKIADAFEVLKKAFFIILSCFFMCVAWRDFWKLWGASASPWSNALEFFSIAQFVIAGLGLRWYFESADTRRNLPRRHFVMSQPRRHFELLEVVRVVLVQCVATIIFSQLSGLSLVNHSATFDCCYSPDCHSPRSTVVNSSLSEVVIYMAVLVVIVVIVTEKTDHVLMSLTNQRRVKIFHALIRKVIFVVTLFISITQYLYSISSSNSNHHEESSRLRRNCLVLAVVSVGIMIWMYISNEYRENTSKMKSVFRVRISTLIMLAAIIFLIVHLPPLSSSHPDESFQKGCFFTVGVLIGILCAVMFMLEGPDGNGCTEMELAVDLSRILEEVDTVKYKEMCNYLLPRKICTRLWNDGDLNPLAIAQAYFDLHPSVCVENIVRHLCRDFGKGRLAFEVATQQYSMLWSEASFC